MDLDKVRKDLSAKYGFNVSDKDVMSYAMYPSVCENYLEFRKQFGPVDKLNTRVFLTGPKAGEEIEVTPIF